MSKPKYFINTEMHLALREGDTQRIADLEVEATQLRLKLLKV